MYKVKNLLQTVTQSLCFMNGLTQTILRKICPSLSQNVFTTYRDTDTAHQSWWWKFKSTCTCTTCPTDQSLRPQNICLKFWKMGSLMLCVPVQNRLKGKFWEIILSFTENSLILCYILLLQLFMQISKTLHQFYSYCHRVLLPITTREK